MEDAGDKPIRQRDEEDRMSNERRKKDLKESDSKKERRRVVGAASEGKKKRRKEEDDFDWFFEDEALFLGQLENIYWDKEWVTRNPITKTEWNIDEAVGKYSLGQRMGYPKSDY